MGRNPRLCEHLKIPTKMSRNILELKSISIAPEKVQTLAVAKRLAKLKDCKHTGKYILTK